MSRDRHPAGRHLTVVKDAAAVAEWWEAERAAARRDVAIARLAHTLAWCIVALTGTFIAIAVLDAIGGR